MLVDVRELRTDIDVRVVLVVIVVVSSSSELLAKPNLWDS